MSEPQKKHRRSRKSFDTQLQEALDDAAKATSENREISICKLIQARIEHLAPRAQAELDEKTSRALEGENAELSTLRTAHETTTKEIKRLESEVAQFRSHVCPVEVKIVPDPEHVRSIDNLTERNTRLAAQVAFLSKHVVSKETIALQAVRELDRETASEVCENLGWKYPEVALFNLSHKTFDSWQEICNRASSNGNAVKLSRAAIQLDISTKTSDPLTAAKYLTGTIRTTDA